MGKREVKSVDLGIPELRHHFTVIEADGTEPLPTSTPAQQSVERILNDANATCEQEFKRILGDNWNNIFPLVASEIKNRMTRPNEQRTQGYAMFSIEIVDAMSEADKAILLDMADMYFDLSHCRLAIEKGDINRAVYNAMNIGYALCKSVIRQHEKNVLNDKKRTKPLVDNGKAAAYNPEAVDAAIKDYRHLVREGNLDTKSAMKKAAVNHGMKPGGLRNYIYPRKKK